MDDPAVRLGYSGGNGEARVIEIELDPDNPVAPEPIVSGGDQPHAIVILRHKRTEAADEPLQCLAAPARVIEIEIDPDNPVAPEPVVSGGDEGDVIVIMRHKSPTVEEHAQDDA